jgi:hypothetical protein
MSAFVLICSKAYLLRSAGLVKRGHPRHDFFVAANLGNLTVLEPDDLIATRNRRKAMRNHDYG